MFRNKPNVLLVDDVRGNLVALEAVLGSDNNLTFATSGEDAIEVVRTRPDIDLVLMDVHMPTMDGFEAARRIKALPSGANIPIVFITAVHKDDPYVRRGYEVGGIDYFGKPFDPDVLKRKVAIYSSFRLKEELVRQREARIREEEKLIRAGLDLVASLRGLRVGAFVVDASGAIQQATADLLPRLTFWGAALAEPIRHALASGEVVRKACVEPGGVCALTCVVCPVCGDGASGAVVVVQDATPARELAADLEASVTKLVQALS
jgi:CheY-like chemotaxis protein